MTDTSRRGHLRAATSRAHAALDAAVGDLATLADYRGYLSGTARFRAAAEAALDALAPHARRAGWTPLRLLPDLRADLADLGLPPLPPETPPLALDDRPEAALGLLYVMEGSALGARLLWRRAQALGLHAGHGARHLARQAAPGDRWPRFLAVLEAADPFDLPATVAAANAAFARARAAFGTPA